MPSKWWLDVGLGVGLGALYIAALLLTTRYAVRRKSSRRFMLIFIGGMAARAALALITIVLILLLVPVDAPRFVGSFLVVFLVGLALEVRMVHRGGWSDTGG